MITHIIGHRACPGDNAQPGRFDRCYSEFIELLNDQLNDGQNYKYFRIKTANYVVFTIVLATVFHLIHIENHKIPLEVFFLHIFGFYPFHRKP
jgi:hypothetical protein